MFPAILVIVLSLLKASSCAPSAPVSGNDPGGHRCYSCASVDKPYLCNVTTQCRPDEQCYTDEYSTNHGLSSFSVGCRRVSECHAALVGRSDPSRRDVKRLKCVECCHGNLCNAGGCSAGLGKGNVCYSCSFINDPRRCEDVTRCQADESCYIEKMFTEDFKIKYNLGCVGNGECETLRQFGQPVGKRDKAISTMCATCCYGDKCNDVCFVQGITSGQPSTSKNLSTTQTSYVTSTPPMRIDTIVVDIPYASPSMGIDTIVVDTSYASPSMGIDTTVVDTLYASPSMGIDTIVVDTSYASPSMGIDSTVVDTLYASPSMGIDTIVVDTSYASPSMGIDTTVVDTLYASPSMGIDTIVVDTSYVSPSMGIDTTVVDTLYASPSMGIDTIVVDTSYASPSMGIDTAVVDTSYASPSMGIDTIVVDTSYASPSMGIDTTVVDTLYASPSMGIDTIVVDTSYVSPSMSIAATVVDTSSTSPLMSIDTTGVDTTIDASSTSPLMRIDTTVVDTSYASASMNMATTVVDATNEAHSSPNPKSTVYALSTMGHTATVSPSTSTTPSKSTHGTSPGNASLSTVCQADCDGRAQCTFLATLQRCSSQTPYCFTQIDNDDSGNSDIRKGCADRNTCNTKWWKQTSDENLCVNFKPGIKSTFTCSYCCTSDRCNFKNVIPTVSLFKGTD
ncbi:uncharacterized protein [Haliotis cracherodii]|uniref:uncharacterized protein n=1 Tax=Haliotis cracherodii TaxID=6455 RepID=UPI0039ED10C3